MNKQRLLFVLASAVTIALFVLVLYGDHTCSEAKGTCEKAIKEATAEKDIHNVGEGVYKPNDKIEWTDHKSTLYYKGSGESESLYANLKYTAPTSLVIQGGASGKSLTIDFSGEKLKIKGDLEYDKAAKLLFDSMFKRYTACYEKKRGRVDGAFDEYREAFNDSSQ